MAISPGIPTSFVPKQPAQVGRPRAASPSNNVFFIVAMAVLAIAIVASVITFVYARYLDGALEEKSAELESAQAAVNQAQVQSFIQLRDRLVTSKTLLDNHITLSPFFDTVERLTLQNVQFNKLSVEVATDRTATMEALGVARNFNTLAAQSNALATEKNVKRAIFSTIQLDRDTGGIGFTLNANLAAPLVIGGPIGSTGSDATLPVPAVIVPRTATSSAPVASSTATTTRL